ncbi:hypothetical protein FRC02_011447 [Tulasnella sp. 418]|nr:hypothetical protein FRC02_011447 [Tulasnella sp. 418]
MVHLSAQQKAENAAVQAFLERPETIALFRNPELADPCSTVFTGFMEDVKKLHSGIDSMQNILSVAGQLQKTNTSLKTALEMYRKAYKDFKAQTMASGETQGASHCEKQALAAAFNWLKKPNSLKDYINGKCPNPYTIVYRERTKSPYQLRTHLYDSKLQKKRLKFYTLEADESAIFLSETVNPETGESKKHIEMVVLRNMAMDAPHGAELYELMDSLVMEAINDRRNVRPQHDGSMIQVGWNAGPRHARVFGLAKSYTKKLDETKKAQRDSNIVAAFSVMWNMSKAFLPAEVTKAGEDALRSTGMPALATRHVREGLGYQFSLGGKEYNFPLARRAPPEGYMSQDYVAWAHVDKAYAKYSFAWCVKRELDPTKKRKASAKNVQMLRGGGGNFVDLTLRVLVKQAAGTLIAFKSELPHGTTTLAGAHNRHMSIAFSQHVATAFAKAQQGNEVISGGGAGHGQEGSNKGTGLGATQE